MEEHERHDRMRAVAYTAVLAILVGALGLYVDIAILGDSDLLSTLREDPLSVFGPGTLLILGTGTLGVLGAARMNVRVSRLAQVLCAISIAYGGVATAAVIRTTVPFGSVNRIVFAAGAVVTFVVWIAVSVIFTKYLLSLTSNPPIRPS